MTTLVIAKASGGISLMRLVNDGDEATCIEQWKESNPGEYVSHAGIDESRIPGDRSQRDAWALVDGAIVVDESLLPVPQVVSRKQARQALLLNGTLSAVQPAIDAIPDATERGLAQIAWDDAQQFVRDDLTLLQIAAALGLGHAALDALFRQAATL